MSTSVCPVCDGLKHIPNPKDPTGLWIQCPCLKQERIEINSMRAGITFPVADLGVLKVKDASTRDINADGLEQLVKAEGKLKAGQHLNKIYCLQGTPSGPKDLFVQSLIYAGISAGLTASQKNLEHLISNRFSTDQEDNIPLEEDFKRYGIYCISFGSETQFNIAGSILQELVRLRWAHPNHTLIFHTNLRYQHIFEKYTDAVHGLFVDLPKREFKGERRVVFTEVENL